MNRTRIFYWITTGFVVLVMAISGAMAITHTPRFMAALARLGYPPYFANVLGVAKLAGIIVLLAPGRERLKEWAYAGFGFTVLSACYSHYMSGDGLMALDPLLTFAALLVSYLTQPANRASVLAPRTQYSEASHSDHAREKLLEA